jgi:hypothetical protein
MVLITPDRLLRLFPRIWRLRYGKEFLALLEETPLTRAVVIDTVRTASWEWLRWTRIGRAVLALLVAFPLAGIESWVNRSWPFPSQFGIPTTNWSQFTAEMLIVYGPFVVATTLLLVARPPSDPRKRIGFAAQLLTLAICAVADQWLSPSLGSPQVHSFSRNWLGSGFFIALFLIWLFNIEGGALARYPRRLGISGLDDDR